MSNVSVCKKCSGIKKIAPLGGIEKECDVCKGIGWMSDVILPNPDIIKPKRGRPKKDS